jgi:hypothetical protein
MPMEENVYSKNLALQRSGQYMNEVRENVKLGVEYVYLWE